MMSLCSPSLSLSFSNSFFSPHTSPLSLSLCPQTALPLPHTSNWQVYPDAIQFLCFHLRQGRHVNLMNLLIITIISLIYRYFSFIINLPALASGACPKHFSLLIHPVRGAESGGQPGEGMKNQRHAMLSATR